MDKEIEVTDKILAALNHSGGEAINAYMDWYIVNAIFWITLCIGLIVLIIKWKPKDAERWEIPPVIIKSIGVVICLVIIGAQVPNLASPKAVATHTLIRDIRKN